MLFWTLTAALVAAVASILALALLRSRPTAMPAASYDMQVYRDQLKDVERDLKRGVLSDVEADRLRLEISRRVLEADRALRGGEVTGQAPTGVTLAAGLLAGAVMAGAFWLYGSLGAPGYPDLPLSARIDLSNDLYANRPSQAEAEANLALRRSAAPAIDPQFEELILRLRETVAQRPNDLVGLQLLARNEAALGEYKAAYMAQKRLIALKGSEATTSDYAALADLMVLAAGGTVTPEAEAVLTEVLNRDPNNGMARYYIGWMMLQNERPDRTFQIWSQLLEAGPETAPWIAPIRRFIMDLAWLAGETKYAPPPPRTTGPSRADIAAAAALPAEQRDAALRPLVSALSAQMAASGGSANDWARLIEGLGALGETERAQAIWDEAQTTFAQRPSELAMISDAAASVGLSGAVALSGPTERDIEAAASLSPQEQMEMIRGMVEGLNARLATEGGSAAEWAQLIGALGALGETERATAIWGEARLRFAENAEAMALIGDAAMRAGVAQ